MNKKLSLLLAVMFIIFAASGCSNAKEKEVEINIGENSNIVRREKSSEEKFYEITVPKVLYDEISSITVKNGKELGLSEYTIEKDGSVTYKISADKKSQVISAIKKFSVDSINALMNSTTIIKDIKISENFDYINIMVSKSQYNKSKITDFENNSAKYILLYTAFGGYEPKESYTVGFSVIDPTDFSEIDKYEYNAPKKVTPEPTETPTIDEPSEKRE